MLTFKLEYNYIKEEGFLNIILYILFIKLVDIKDLRKIENENKLVEHPYYNYNIKERYNKWNVLTYIFFLLVFLYFLIYVVYGCFIDLYKDFFVNDEKYYNRYYIDIRNKK